MHNPFLLINKSLNKKVRGNFMPLSTKENVPYIRSVIRQMGTLNTSSCALYLALDSCVCHRTSNSCVLYLPPVNRKSNHCHPYWVLPPILGITALNSYPEHSFTLSHTCA